MIFRFSLYGFLKNQRYFEPFLLLAFLQMGLSYSAIGLLLGFREVCINLLEIPTGAIADVVGRRKSMILSMVAYTLSFWVFGTADVLWTFFAAMFLFSIGEALRTGTHKAIIFDWLKRQGRADEKTTVYGYTRSWSKMGSAVSVVIAAVLVFFADSYSQVFLLSMIPPLLNIVNFFGYPTYLEGTHGRHKSVGQVWRTLVTSVGTCFRMKPLRRLLAESASYEGLYKASKDYLQPVLQTAALSLPLFLAFENRQRTALLVGVVYFVLHFASSIASRKAGFFAERSGGEAAAGQRLWVLYLGGFVLMGVGITTGAYVVTVGTFVMLAIVQNFWRPILISRCATLADEDKTATILSAESQSKSLFVAVFAPVLGWSIDWLTTAAPSLEFLPLAVLGVVVSSVMLLTMPKTGCSDRDISWT